MPSSPSPSPCWFSRSSHPGGTRTGSHGLLALWPSYLSYALTFLFIGQVWVNHPVMFDHIRAADRAVLLLNTLLLMVVAFLPLPGAGVGGVIPCSTSIVAELSWWTATTTSPTPATACPLTWVSAAADAGAASSARMGSRAIRNLRESVTWRRYVTATGQATGKSLIFDFFQLLALPASRDAS